MTYLLWKKPYFDGKTTLRNGCKILLLRRITQCSTKCNFVLALPNIFMVGNCVTAVYSFSIGEKKCISRDFLQKKTEDRREGKLCHFCGHITPQLNFQLSSRFQELAFACCVSAVSPYPGVKLKNLGKIEYCYRYSIINFLMVRIKKC